MSFSINAEIVDTETGRIIDYTPLSDFVSNDTKFLADYMEIFTAMSDKFYQFSNLDLETIVFLKENILYPESDKRQTYFTPEKWLEILNKINFDENKIKELYIDAFTDIDIDDAIIMKESFDDLIKYLEYLKYKKVRVGLSYC
ncbi:MAG: hypothetical protein WCJ19_02505 [bacterium]